MANLTLVICDNCGYGQFGLGGYIIADGAAVRMPDGREMQVCSMCVAHLEARQGMYELTGNAAAPTKVRTAWPPDREQIDVPKRSS